MKRKRSKTGTRNKPEQDSGVGPARRGLFLVLMWLLPVAFFMVLEGGLRLFGFGDDYPLFVEVPDYPEYRFQNRDVARRYFTRQDRVPTGLSDVFRADKDSLVYRIIVQGGSSAAGYPYYYGGSFSRMLEQRLQQTFPDREIEIVNTALAAVNSFTLLDFADEIIDASPDAILIYAGHNEYYGALGVGSAESLGRFPGLIRLYLRLQRFRTAQAVRSLLARVAGLLGSAPDDGSPGQTLMEAMVGEQRIPYGSATYRLGIEQFRGNLELLLGKYTDRGIPVYIGTVASNEGGQAPFISATWDPGDQARYDSLVAEGRLQVRRSNHGSALRLFSEAIMLDSTAARAYFERAGSFEVVGQMANAAEDYTRARDRDQLRFRASEEINDVIRETAERYGARVVPSSEALHRASPNGIVDNRLILEHLHPNVDGYYLIADAFYEALHGDNRIGPWVHHIPTSEARQEILLTAVDSLYGAFRLIQLMGSWPFEPPGTIDRSLDTLQAANLAESLALSVIRSELNWYQATNRLGDHYASEGDFHRALRTRLAQIQQYPFLSAPYAQAGETLANQGRLVEALSYFEAANDREESAGVLNAIGSVNVLLGRSDEGLLALERSYELESDDEETLIRLAALYAGLGRRTDAIRLLEHLLAGNPQHPGAIELMRNLRAGA